MKIEKLNGGMSLEPLKPGDIVTPKNKPGPAWQVVRMENNTVRLEGASGAEIALGQIAGANELLLTSHSELQALAQFESIKEKVQQFQGAELSQNEDVIETTREAIQETPLSVEVRGPWRSVSGGIVELDEIAEFKILLCTGGPAVRIIGELNQHGEPASDPACFPRLEHQDWGTPWTEFKLFSEEDRAILLEFCSQFYFGDS